MIELLYESPPEHGLYPTEVSTLTGKPVNSYVTFGSLSDSFYEYLVKSWIQVRAVHKPVDSQGAQSALAVVPSCTCSTLRCVRAGWAQGGDSVEDVRPGHGWHGGQAAAAHQRLQPSHVRRLSLALTLGPYHCP